MEKSNLPLPLKRKTLREAIYGVRDGKKPEKRTTVQFKHSLVRDTSGRVSRERSQFSGGSYLKKRFGYNSKKTGIPFSLKGSKAVVTSLCAAGDFADACFPVSSENTDSAQDSTCAKRGALSMKNKLLQLQERNRLILAKHQFPRMSPQTQANPDLNSSALLVTPFTLKIETKEEEAQPGNEQARLGESCSTSPIYHELDPIDGYSSPEQHTYQSISEVREEMARLQAQRDFGSTTFAGEKNPANTSLEISECSIRESQKKLYESSGTVQESEPKQNRQKRSIFSKFWLSRRNLLTSQDDGRKAVLTAITPLPEEDIAAPQAGDGLPNHSCGVELCSQPSSLHLSYSQTHATSKTPSFSWNAYNNHSFSCTGENCHGVCIATDFPCYDNTCSNYSNRDGIGGSYDGFYGWKSDDEVESEGRMGSAVQKTLHSFAKRSAVKPCMKTKTSSVDYFSRTEMANALTKYHWNAYQTRNVNRSETVALLSTSRRADNFLEASRKDTRVFFAFHQDQNAPGHLLSVPVPQDQATSATVLTRGLNTSDIYSDYSDNAFLHNPSTTSGPTVRGKLPHSQFSSPSCGVRMAEMRAVRRKSESSTLLIESSTINIASHSTISRHCKSTAGSCNEQGDMSLHSVAESVSCEQTEPAKIWRDMHTIVEEDQLPENVSSSRLEVLHHSAESECSPGLSENADHSSAEPTINHSIAPSDSSNTSAEFKIPQEMSSSSGSSVNDNEHKSGDLTKVVSQTKRFTDTRTTGSKLKQPKPIKQCTTSSQTKLANYTGESSTSIVNLPSEQHASSSKDKKYEDAGSHTPLSLNSNKVLGKEPKPLIRQAVVRQIESVSAASDTGLGLSDLLSTQRTLQSTPQIKSASCIPRTKHLLTNRTYSADEKPTCNIGLHEKEASKRRVDYVPQKKHLNYRSLEIGTGSRSISKSFSEEVTFQHKAAQHLDSLSSLESTELLHQHESNCAGQTPEVTVHSPDSLEYRDYKFNTQLCNSGEYVVSAISSLSSSLTSSNSSGSVFGVTESDSESPLSMSVRDFNTESESPISSGTRDRNADSESPVSSSGTRDINTKSESPTSSGTRDLTANSESPTSSGTTRMETHSNTPLNIPVQDSTSKDAEPSGSRMHRGKSQLLAPRTDATQCLERIERLRIETKQTKNEFHQKLRH